jgi:hypothetical protein
MELVTNTKFMSATLEELRATDPLRFPIGPYTVPNVIDEDIIDEWIGVIANFPRLMRAEIEILHDDQLLWRYRPQGWNIRQVVHHCADSHMNAFTRFKLSLTEDSPEIRPYLENLWGDMNDNLEAPVAWSLDLIQALHARWSFVLKAMGKSDFDRSYYHPEYQKHFRLDEALGNYAWHCNHHLAHVIQAKELQYKK